MFSSGKFVKIKKLLFVILISVILVLFAGSLYLYYPLSLRISLSGEDSNNVPEDGGLRYDRGPIPVISVSGTPFERGYQHGVLLADELQEIMAVLEEEVMPEVSSFSGIKESLQMRYMALKYFNYIAEDYQQELKGIARGADVSLYRLLLINVFDELFNMANCTNLAVWGDFTEEGTVIHGRNLDYIMEDRLYDRQVVIYYKPQNGPRFVSVAFPGYIGVLTGMNEKGLTLGSLTAPAVEKSLEGVPTGLLYREIMETAVLLDDAAFILNSNPRTIGNNLLVSSARDKSATVLEISAREVWRRSGEDFIVAANHFNILENSSVLSTSTFRQDRGEELLVNRAFYSDDLREDEYITVEDMKDILNDRVTETEYGGGPGFYGIGNDRNIQSVVFVPHELELWISINQGLPAAGEVFYPFRFDTVSGAFKAID